MHEYSVTKSIIQIVLEEASKVNATKVLEIRLAIGELSSFVDDSIKMYFDFFTENTIAHGAKLQIRKIPAEFFCSSCKSNYIPVPIGFECPKCGQTGSYSGSGKEFLIESIEVE